jgi:hypothetical protein
MFRRETERKCHVKGSSSDICRSNHCSARDEAVRPTNASAHAADPEVMNHRTASSSL